MIDVIPNTILEKFIEADLGIICGPTGSGKTTLANQIGLQLGISVLALDRYFLDRPAAPTLMSETGQLIPQWDSPEAYDYERLVLDIDRLFLAGESLVPTYSFAEQSRSGLEVFSLGRSRKLIAEGLYAVRLASDPRLASLKAFCVFIRADEETRFNRIGLRDPIEKGIPLDKVEERLDTIREAERSWILSQEALCDMSISL